MDFVVSIGFLVACIWAWRWAALRLSRKGCGWFVRHFMGSCTGLCAGILVVAFAIALGVISPEKKGLSQVVPSTASDPAVLAELKAPDVSVEKAVAVEKIKSLGISPDVYAERLNRIFKRVNSKYRVSAKGIVKGEVNDILTTRLGEYTALVATVSKLNGKVIDVTVIGTGDGTSLSGLDILMVASAALAAAAPAAEFEEVLRVLPELTDGQDRIYGNVKISAMKMKGMGVWFFASSM